MSRTLQKKSEGEGHSATGVIHEVVLISKQSFRIGGEGACVNGPEKY